MKKRKAERKQKKKPSRPDRIISAGKKRLFMFITVLIPVFFLVLLEIGLRVAKYGDDTRLFISTPNEASQFYGINLNVGKRYFTRQSEIPTPRKDLFLKEKPKNGYRCFVLGGSTTAGYPYGNNVTFTRILNRRLSDTFPEKHIEIINTAMTAINTYTQLDFMDEILSYEPDALLIYSGHNEFYGALGVASMESFGKNRWAVMMILKMQRYKIFLLLRHIVLQTQKWLGRKSTDINVDQTATMMARIVKNKEIPFESQMYNLGKRQFEQNLSDIIQKAQKADLDIIISELVSNVYDHKPFVSIGSNTLPPAKRVYGEARKLEKQGQYEEARKKYYLAKDLDALRFRASEDFNEIIRELALEYKIPLVPMKLVFESNSDHKFIGNNLMHEHLHPNIDGYFLMADAFYDTMRELRFIGRDWNSRSVKPSSYYRNHWGFTKLDSVYASLAVTQLKGGWPFKTQEGPNLAIQLYNPTSLVDSIALQVFKGGESTLELGHIRLAKFYERQGDLESAYKEYQALIYIVPFLDLFYQPAVKVLISMKDYRQALQILSELLRHQENAFAYKWIGQIYLIVNETRKGIHFLEKAMKMTPGDTQVLFNLGRAYFHVSEYQKGEEILVRLKRRAPNSSFVAKLENYKNALDLKY